MNHQYSTISPQWYARSCGILYLYIFVAGIFAEVFVRSKLIVPKDAAATATNILANESLFRLGFSGELLHLSCDVAVAVLLYALFRRVNREVALLAALMRLMCALVLAVASLGHFAALQLLGGLNYLKTFTPDQLQSLALLAMKLQGDGYTIALLFFSFACLALGYLIFKSGYFPQTIGVLMLIAGGCYFINSLVCFLNPLFGARLFNAGILVPCFVAELSLTLWLIVKGVDVAQWEKNGMQLVMA